MRLETFIKLGIYLFHKNYSIFWREICIGKPRFGFVSHVVQTVVQKNQTNTKKLIRVILTVMNIHEGNNVS